jgi:hypothetical protein
MRFLIDSLFNIAIINTVFLGLIAPLSVSGDVQSGCTNFNSTKQKLNAVLRAYGCESSTSLSACKMALGLGVEAFSINAIVAAGVIGKGAHNQIRNTDYLVCPTAMLSSEQNNNQFVINLVFGEPAWASCYDLTKVAQTEVQSRIRSDLNLTNQEIDKNTQKLKELKEAASNGVSNQALDQDNLKKIASTQTLIENINQSMTSQNDNFIEMARRVGQSSGNKNTISQLVEQAKEGAKIKTEVLKGVLGPNYDTKDLQLLMARMKSLNELFNQKNNLAALQRDAEVIKQVVATGSKVNGVQAEIELAQQKLQDLKLSRKKLEELAKEASGNLDRQGVLSIIHKIANGGVYSSSTKNSLNNISASLRSNVQKELAHKISTLAANKMSMNNLAGQKELAELAEEVKKNGLSPLKWVKTAALSIGGGLGLSEIASAADLEDLSNSASDAFDPVSVIIHSKSLGGKNCDDVRSSAVVAKNSDKGCNFDYNMNDKVAAVLSNSNDNELSVLASSDVALCDFINRNYLKYYPKPVSKPNCQSSTIDVEFENGTSLGLTEDQIYFRPNKDKSAIKYSQSQDSYSFVEDRKNITLTSKQAKEQGSSSYGQAQIMMATALEIQSCCHPNGITPSEIECGRYGIKLDPSGLEKSPPSGGSGAGSI